MFIKSKILGALYGFAIGDSMGATTEFMTEAEIKRQYGQVDDLIGGGWLKLKPGEVTDDTQMMICVIDAIMSVSKEKGSLKAIGNDFKKECMQNFVKWFLTGPKDVGNQCAKAIRYYMATKQYIYLEKDDIIAAKSIRVIKGFFIRTFPASFLLHTFARKKRQSRERQQAVATG